MVRAPCSGLALVAAILCGCGSSVVEGVGGGGYGGTMTSPTTCEPGTVTVCYEGPDGTESVGPCSAGTRTCTQSGEWGPCVGQAVPAPETCGNAIDDDCNGAVDDGCVCDPRKTETCYTGPPATAEVGICVNGERVCDAEGSGFGACMGEILPSTEDCATPVDDDCDGEANEECPCAPGESASCYSGPLDTAGVGLCEAGVHICEASGLGYGPCMGEMLPATEDCATAEDDDCDGEANEGCVCVPGSTSSCYSGPAGTEGVGACVAGTMTCNSLGTGYGPCMGEVTPEPEVCATPVDEDCDGITAPCPGSTLCSMTIPVYSNEVTTTHAAWNAVAVDALGNIGVAGFVRGQTLDLGGGVLAGSGGNYDMLVGKYDTTCQYLWGARYAANGGIQRALGATCQPGGDLVAVGTIANYVDFGLGIVGTTNVSQGVVVSFDAAGTATWNQAFGGHPTKATTVALGPSGELVVAGCFTGSMSLGGQMLTSLGGMDLFLAKLDAQGNHLWSLSFGDSIDQCSNAGVHSAEPSVAVDTTGNVLVAGTYRGVVDFGGGPLASDGGSFDFFLAKFDPNGSHQWSQRFGTSSVEIGGRIAVAPVGDVVLTGLTQAAIDLGGGVLPYGGGGDIVLARYSPSGTHVWSQDFAAPGWGRADGVHVDGSGNILLTGHEVGPFVAKLSGTGQYLWDRQFAIQPSSLDQGAAVTTDAAGNVIAVGQFGGTADFGAGPVTSVSDGDIYMVKLAP